MKQISQELIEKLQEYVRSLDLKYPEFVSEHGSIINYTSHSTLDKVFRYEVDQWLPAEIKENVSKKCKELF